MRKGMSFRGQGLHPAIVAYYFDELGPAERILDLGCGLGSLGKYKPSVNMEIYGLDIDEGAVEVAKAYEIAKVWDLERGRLPFEDGFFDAILAKDVLEHLLKPWIIVEEMYRVLREGGIVVASVPMPRNRVVWGDYTHLRGFTKGALRLMFEDKGFEALYIRKMGGVPLSARLGLVRYIPWVLTFPLFDWLWGRSWEIKARKISVDIL
jgi:SAM-dependent methyltransferase